MLIIHNTQYRVFSIIVGVAYYVILVSIVTCNTFLQEAVLINLMNED